MQNEELQGGLRLLGSRGENRNSSGQFVFPWKRFQGANFIFFFNTYKGYQLGHFYNSTASICSNFLFKGEFLPKFFCIVISLFCCEIFFYTVLFLPRRNVEISKKSIWQNSTKWHVVIEIIKTRGNNTPKTTSKQIVSGL